MESNKSDSPDNLLAATEPLPVNRETVGPRSSPQSEKKDDLIGQTIEKRFLIKRRIGAGGIGVVYLAEDLKVMRREVVVKVLLDDCNQNEDLRRKFEQEIEALTKVKHQSIVEIIDAGTLSNCKPFFVMPYLQGRTVRELLDEKGALPFSLCTHILLNLTDALSAAHGKGILHRDIKPENIMLTPVDGDLDRVWLLDFGIARIFDSKVAPVTQWERGVGTALYVAPEQMRGKLEQTPAVDVYSCGVLAYELLTGVRPFNPTSVYEMLLLQEKGDIKPLTELRPEIPAEAEQLIMRALSIEPADRPQSARAFGKALAAVLQDADRKENNESRKTQLLELNVTEPGLAGGGAGTPDVTHQLPAETKRSKPQATSISHPDFSEQKENSIPEIPKVNANRSPIWLGGVVGAILFVGILMGSIVYLLARSGKVEQKANNQNAAIMPAPTEGKSQVLQYSLELQKMRNGKPERQMATGREIFANGDSFKFLLRSESDGYLYLFNEGVQTPGMGAQFATLFPPRNGSARIKAGERVETGNNIFSGGTGTEVFWLIWTLESNPVLEKAHEAARISQRNGVIEDRDAERQLREFIKNYSATKPQFSKDADTVWTRLEGSGEVLIHKLELEHR